MNGKKDDEIEKEQKSRDDLRRAAYTENRWGTLRFVRGGLLVGDRIEEIGSDEAPAKVPSVGRVEEAPPSMTEVSAIESTKTPSDQATEEANVKSRSKRSKKRKQNEIADQPSKEAVNHQLHALSHNSVIEETRSIEATTAQSKGFVESEEKLKRRSEKAQRKLARQVRREEKRSRRSELVIDKKGLGVAEVEAQDHARQAVAAKPASTQHTGGRYQVRSRYVQQKKMALMNPKALSEVNEISSMNSIYVQVD